MGKLRSRAGWRSTQKLAKAQRLMTTPGLEGWRKRGYYSPGAGVTQGKLEQREGVAAGDLLREGQKYPGLFFSPTLQSLTSASH